MRIIGWSPKVSASSICGWGSAIWWGGSPPGLRGVMIETIRNDPDYNSGNYTTQPRMMKYAVNAYQVATGGGTLGYQTLAPTAAKADQMVDDRLGAPGKADPTHFPL